MGDVAPLRICEVNGFDGRNNDLVFCQSSSSTSGDVVVFFPGDVQDFTENMQSHRDNKRHVKWNLEGTAVLLHKKFPNSHVVVVRPSKMEYKTFSVYNNFVPSTTTGVPEHVPTHRAVEHLQLLLTNISEKLPDGNGSNGQNIRLLGFSKGCVVLNQFLHEFHYWQGKDHPPNLIAKVTDMYWLDGGHNGGKNMWITSKELLSAVANLGIKIHIHVTPYQIRDDRRPWIRKEEKQFYETLLRLGARVDRTVHFEDVEPDINVHFQVLNSFEV